MSTITFDTLKATKQLKESGFTENQAEALVNTMKNSTEDANWVTVEKLDSKLSELKFELLKWIIGLALAQFAVMIGILLKLPH